MRGLRNNSVRRILCIQYYDTDWVPYATEAIELHQNLRQQSRTEFAKRSASDFLKWQAILE